MARAHRWSPARAAARGSGQARAAVSWADVQLDQLSPGLSGQIARAIPAVHRGMLVRFWLFVALSVVTGAGPILFAAVLPGYRWLGWLLAAAWWALAWWMLRRRWRLAKATDDAADFEAQLAAALRLTGQLEQAADLLAELENASTWRSVRVFRHIWRLIRMPGQTWDAISDLPRIGPFLPGAAPFARVLPVPLWVAGASLGSVAIVLVVR